MLAIIRTNLTLVIVINIVYIFDYANMLTVNYNMLYNFNVTQLIQSQYFFISYGNIKQTVYNKTALSITVAHRNIEFTISMRIQSI